jgi:hypothetical protein
MSADAVSGIRQLDEGCNDAHRVRAVGCGAIGQQASRSNNTSYTESLLRAYKYLPDYLCQSFAQVEGARPWTTHLVDLNNHQHRQRRLKFIKPARCHDGEVSVISAKREHVCVVTKTRTLER